MNSKAENIKTEDATEAQIIVNQSTMLGDMVQCVIDELKAMQEPWQKMPEVRQKDVLHRVKSRCESVIEQIVSIISAEGFITIDAAFEQTTIKDGVKLTLTRSISGEEFYKFMETNPKRVKLVNADAKQFTNEQGMPKADPDQADMIEEADEALDEAYDGDQEYQLNRAIALIANLETISISRLQRSLGVGYNNAARLIETMEQRGIISEMQEDGSRFVIANSDAGTEGEETEEVTTVGDNDDMPPEGEDDEQESNE